MRLTVLLCIAASACGGGSSAGAPDADPGPDLMLDALRRADRVLFIGAHPDDESTVAPLLAEACLSNDTECVFLVMTRGEAGRCAGCSEETGAVRARELATSAAIFEADVIAWGFDDRVGGDVSETLDAWAQQAGDAALLIESVAAEIERIDPTLVLSLDPRHGVTCHPGHRATGAVAMAASVQAGIHEDAVWLVGSTIITTGEEPNFESAGYVPMAAEDEALWRYDASQTLPAGGMTGWDTVIDVLSAHATQFSAADVAAFASAPAERRAIYMTRLRDLVLSDPRYENVCDR